MDTEQLTLIQGLTDHNLLDRFEFFAQVVAMVEDETDADAAIRQIEASAVNRQLDMMRAEILRRMKEGRA